MFPTLTWPNGAFCVPSDLDPADVVGLFAQYGQPEYVWFDDGELPVHWTNLPKEWREAAVKGDSLPR